MIKQMQERLRRSVDPAGTGSTQRIPRPLRRGLRAITGGDTWTARFIRGLFWQYRVFISSALVANIGSAVAEAATMAVFTLAVNVIAGSVTGDSVVTGDGITGQIMDFARRLGGGDPLMVLLGLAVALQIMRSSLDFGGQVASAFLRSWMEGDLQRRIFGQLVALRYHKVVDDRLGSLTSYSSQVNNVGQLIAASNSVINDLAIIAAYVSVLFWLSWPMTVIAIIALLFLSRTLRTIRVSIRSQMHQFLDNSVQLNERVIEYLQGLRLVHIFAREDLARAEVNALVDVSVRARRKGLIRGAMILPITQISTIIGVAIFLVAGLWAISNLQLGSAGALVTYVFILYRIMPRISATNHHVATVNSEWPFLVRIANLLNMEGKELEYKPGQAVTALRKAVDVENVHLRYPSGDRDALSDLSFRIPVGEMIALVGSSGSGKSSLINLLLGIYTPTGGKILIDGVDLQQVDLASWRRCIGVVDQDTLIFARSVADNIRFGKPDASDAEVEAAARIANAHDFIRALPNGYATELGDRGFRISGGQRQRIAIARAVISRPDLLLFDEATSALDSESERLIQASIEALRQDSTLVLIAHRLSTVVNADRIIVLHEGRKVEEGTHSELLAQGGRYAALWQLQARGEERPYATNTITTKFGYASGTANLASDALE